MKIIEMGINEITPYEKNARINDNAVEKVADSIREFGFKNPIIIDKNNVIIAGHTRLKAAIMLGMEKVPCICADDLTPEQVKAFRLIDNKTNEFAEWDHELLMDELKELMESSDINFESFGFDIPEDIENINFDDFFTDSGDSSGGSGEDKDKENEESDDSDDMQGRVVTCPHCQKEFEI